MKRLLIATIASAALLAATTVWAQPPAPSPTTGAGRNIAAPNFVDANGNGICDRYEAGGAGQHLGRGRGHGPGDGTGNRGLGPRDGTGYGARAGAGTPSGTGTPVGSGPHGARRGRG